MSFINYRPSAICLAVALATLPMSLPVWAADVVQFNSALFDLDDRENIDLGRFAKAGYIMPGSYPLKIQMNNKDVAREQVVTFYEKEDDPEETEACLTRSLVEQLALKPDHLKSLTWWHQGQCVNLSSLPGSTVEGDLSTTTLYISMPQAYLEYRTDTWEPPSLWDEGISGIMLDYSLNGRTRSSVHGNDSYSLMGNGVAGVNLGAWRFRANWQSLISHTTGSGDAVNTNFKWTQYQAYRALPNLASKLTLGEDNLRSDLFDSFRFTGVGIRSDLNMEPPNLRGYAPEVTGVATTNATVIVSQQGRIIYQTQVAPGPFRIQDLSSAISGTMNVRIEEQDGSVQEFQIEASSVPYLTRVGMVRYKFSVGKPSTTDHHFRGELFATGEFSWGIANGWSLFGGSLNSEHYNALSLGVGRDLLHFGAISFDITQSFANLENEGHFTGGSYRISYSKRFNDYGSSIQFAGYRFSERDFMNMSEYLSFQENGYRSSSSKQMYTVSLSQQFEKLGLNAYFTYNHQTYWNSSSTDRYNLSLNKIVSFWGLDNVNLSLSLYKSVYNDTNDKGVYFSMSAPFGVGSSLGYSLSASSDETLNRVTYYDRLDSNTSYQLSGGNVSGGHGYAGAYIGYDGSNARLTASTTYVDGSYSTFGLSAQGGMTMTLEGGRIHRNSLMGGTRLLVSTDGVSGIPVKGTGAVVYSNDFGKLVLPNISSYYRNKFKVDLNKMPDDAEVTESIITATLTEGAIGYRELQVVSGRNMMVTITLPDGSSPPFGAQIVNQRNQDTGIMNDNGEAYISGINPNSVMTVRWAGQEQCKLHFPDHIDETSYSLSLECQTVSH